MGCEGCDEPKEKTTMGQILEAFRLADIQTCVNIIETLLQHGKDIADVKEWLASIEDPGPQLPGPPRRMLLRRCPECRYFMRILPVNDNKCTKTGNDDEKSQWICEKCWYEEFSTKEPVDEAEPYIMHMLWKD